MVEPSDTERAELPECSAKYIEDLEAENERKDEAIVLGMLYIEEQNYNGGYKILKQALGKEE